VPRKHPRFSVNGGLLPTNAPHRRIDRGQERFATLFQLGKLPRQDLPFDRSANTHVALHSTPPIDDLEDLFAGS
jgi:hypothetical protein